LSRSFPRRLSAATDSFDTARRNRIFTVAPVNPVVVRCTAGLAAASAGGAVTTGVAGPQVRTADRNTAEPAAMAGIFTRILHDGSGG
jgi:hypothetical protein